MRTLLRGIYVFVSFQVLIILFSCSKKNDPESLVITPTVNPIPYSVLVYLLTPNDKTFNPDYYRAAKSAILDIQRWYKTQMGDKTFVLNPVVVDTITGSHNSTWYVSNNGDSISHNSPSAFYNTKFDMKQLLGPKFDTTLYTYFVYVATNFPDETIPRGIVVEGSSSLDGIIGTNPGISLGDAGHALGHAFGLPEVAVPNADGIMSNGWSKYPNCVLKQNEKDSLNAGPFFKVQ
jgi:hypothetical protein